MELLRKLYTISSYTGKEAGMINFISRRLKALAIPFEIDYCGNIYATKGNAATYPCIVAHMDEVHPAHPKSFQVVNFRNEIIFGYDAHKKQFSGIGADDKNGIWVCLKCLEEFECLKCAFFVQEEDGCKGSMNADMSFFDDCRYIIQCDRRGSSDWIKSISGINLCSEKFIKAANPRLFGYKYAKGLPTDIYQLKKNGLKISCVNLSCGYYNPHTSEEYTVIEDLCNCYRFVRHIIASCIETYPHHVYFAENAWPDFYFPNYAGQDQNHFENPIRIKK